MRKILLKFRFVIYFSLISGVIAGGAISSYTQPLDTKPEIAKNPTIKPFVQGLSKFGQLLLASNAPKKSDTLLSAWIPEWDWENGIESFSKNADSFSQINPIWYHVDKFGNLKPTSIAGNKKLQKIAEKHNVQFVPTIQEFDADYLHKALRDNIALRNHASKIITIVDKYKLDGIDLDYEMIYLKDRENFYEFLKHLSNELKKRGKVLVFDAMSKTTDEKDSYNSFVETRQVQDWTILAKYVDQIRIMAYDYDNSNPKGSPINPYYWIEEIAAYAVTKANPKKFVIGTPLYSYSWRNGKIIGSFTYNRIKEGINKRGAKPVFDEKAKEWQVILADNGKSDEEDSDVLGEADKNLNDDEENEATKSVQIVWYQDATSFQHRLNLVKHYNLAGLALWRLGGEDTRIYEAFE